MDMQSNKSFLHEKRAIRTTVRARRRRADQAPVNAWLDSGVPAFIGGLAASAAAGLSIIPAAGVAAAAGLGYTFLRMRVQRG